MKKILALVLALAMVLMVGASFADGDDAPATASTLPTDDITISGLESGDDVTLYKVIKWDSAASDWAFDGITVTGYSTVEALVTALNGNDAMNAMTALINAINATNPAKATEDTGAANSSGVYSYNAEVGSYLALISTATANVYNPMILSVNFENPTTGDGGAVNASTDTVGTSGYAKKQEITLDKEVNDASDDHNDVAVGDYVPFKVTTVTPNYGTNYTNPTFTLTDTLSTGITMSDKHDVVVKNGTTTLSAKENAEDTEYDYEITTSESGYTISFSTAYLTAVKANTQVTVEYYAKINSKAVMHQVERYTNDVDLVFSNSPETENSSLHDKTNHYTFGIDAYLTGENGGEGSEITKELIKVGVDAEGNVLTEWVTSDESSWTWSSGVEALQGATFTLTGNDHTYSATSDENGFLTFTGLDEGTYELVETGAPAGYKYSTDPISVVIDATYWETNDQGHAPDELKEYSITIGGTATSTYSVTNNGTYEISETIEKTVGTNKTFPINNIKGVTLPSTGGIGTTIFYILGGLLVVGAVVILVARRKAQD